MWGCGARLSGILSCEEVCGNLSPSGGSPRQEGLAGWLCRAPLHTACPQQAASCWSRVGVGVLNDLNYFPC